MKTIIVAVFALFSKVGNCSNIDLFQKFVAENNKQYSFSEYAKKLEVFNENLKVIEELNQMEGTAEFGINKYADLTEEEFRFTYLMTPSEAPVHSADKYLSVEQNYDIPTDFNWADNSAVVSRVKDQGSLGSCWIFSTTGNLEGQVGLKGNGPVSLSEEQFLECDGTIDPTNMNSDCSMFGGWPYLAMQYAIKNGGVASEADYPYCQDFDTEKVLCLPCTPPTYNETRCGPGVIPPMCDDTIKCRDKKFPFAAKVHDWKQLPEDEDQIASYLYENGPLSVALDARTLQFYKKGILKPGKLCSKTKLDHAVLITGYGVDNSEDFWWVKNSWGAKWGIDGYFRIAKGEGECGINTAVVTGLVR